MEVIFTLNQIAATARQFLAQTAAHKVVALHGEMGAGKTTFTHALCNALGVQDAISSPTFSIINQYKTKDDQTVYHIDLYRIKDAEEAIQSGIEDTLFSGSYCFVEWPERAPSIFPDHTLHIHIGLVDNNTRKLTFNV
jgi:tRNA threonylcarbamoyladenosine biosynthesis protein TsaE